MKYFIVNKRRGTIHYKSYSTYCRADITRINNGLISKDWSIQSDYNLKNCAAYENYYCTNEFKEVTK